MLRRLDLQAVSAESRQADALAVGGIPATSWRVHHAQGNGLAMRQAAQASVAPQGNTACPRATLCPTGVVVFDDAGAWFALAERRVAL